MKLKVLNINKVIYDNDVKEVILPGKDGEFSVMDFHCPFLYSLNKGKIKIVSKQDKPFAPSLALMILGGLAQMSGNQLTVLTQVD